MVKRYPRLKLMDDSVLKRHSRGKRVLKRRIAGGLAVAGVSAALVGGGLAVKGHFAVPKPRPVAAVQAKAVFDAKKYDVGLLKVLGKKAESNVGRDLRYYCADVYHGCFVPVEVNKIFDFCAKNRILPLDFFWAGEHLKSGGPVARKVHAFLSANPLISEKIQNAKGSMMAIDAGMQMRGIERAREKQADRLGYWPTPED